MQRTLRADDLHLWVNRLAAMSSTDRAELPGVSQVRAEQVLADIHEWVAADEERIAAALGIDTPAT